MDLKAELTDQQTDGRHIANFLTNTDERGAQTQTETYLRSRLVLLDSYWANVFNRNRLLRQHEEDLAESKYFKEAKYERYEEAYAHMKGTLLDRVTALSPPEAPASTAILSPQQLTTTHFSLPKFQLPRFSVEQVEWEKFRERFCAMVKNDTTLSSVLKLQHLLSCLDGEPARRVRNLPMIGTNFAVAWDILLKRYDIPAHRLSTHLRKLLRLQTAVCKTAVEITSLMGTIAAAQRAFTLLARPVDQWDDWFIEIIILRLDQDLREDWRKTCEGKTELLFYKDLTTFLENRVLTLTTSTIHEPPSSRQSPQKGNTSKGGKSLSAHHTSITTDAGNPQRPPPAARCARDATSSHTAHPF